VADLPDLNFFNTIARHPALAKRWSRMAGWLIAKGTIPARERELATLRTAFRCRAVYSWSMHAKIGVKAGLRPQEIERVVRNPATAGWSRHDTFLLQAVDELHDFQQVTDVTWAGLAEQFSEQQLIEFCMLIGNYHLVDMTLNSIGVEQEADATGFPAP
jgi:alkylhydroperoxidase family enzyme